MLDMSIGPGADPSLGSQPAGDTVMNLLLDCDLSSQRSSPPSAWWPRHVCEQL